jgi:hypothetical protein
LSEQGNRGFRDVVADADDLGRAAAQASRSARDTYNAVPSPSREFDRLEPDMEPRGGILPDEAPYSFDESVPEADNYQPAPSRIRSLPQSRSGFPIGRIVKLAVTALVLVLIGVGVWKGGPRVMSLVQSMTSSSKTADSTPAAGQPAVQPKINDRVGQPSSTPVAPVAQRVVLYDEDPSDPQGKQYVGSVVWKTESVPGASGQPPDVAARADIDIPDRKFKMSIVFRRNTDASLPASHTAELTFQLPPDFDGGGISNVPGMLMKTNEQTRGTPLAGLAVKVTDGFFLLGLSNVDADRSRNIQLLKERPWIDIPLVYNTQRRAIIAVEKGEPGDRVFNEVFTAWGQ